MAKLNYTRASQDVQVAEFTFTVTDTMTNTSGAEANFTLVQANVFDVMDMPPSAVVIGGDVVTETAVGGSTAYNVKVGDATSDVRYLGTTDKVAAGRTALVPTGFVTTGEKIRLTVTPTVGAATSGKITLRVMFVIRGRQVDVL